MSSRISFSVHGQVQGVNFRSWTIEQAQSMGLTGMVGNDPAGHVAGEAQGDKSKIDQFVQQLNKGPSAAMVDKVETKEIGTKSGEKGFNVSS